ncbi:MAG TPA: 3-deoxy-7-phosphoheptulonate synthase, partial [Myxococcaceae bacterium]|nr:3-deoxy-7-phosphoheptulonate synthase [Myxococcaceae bacterium]
MRPTSPAADPSVPARVLRTARPSGTRVAVGPVEIGGPGFVVVAGPCAVESAAQTEAAAEVVAAAGANLLRGGVFKPRTSPYAFQGLGEAGLSILGRSGARHGLPVVAEILEPSQLPSMIERVDVLQVGARNMQNFALLRALGKMRRPVLLKRGFAATV